MVSAPVQLYQRYTTMIMLIPGHSKHHVCLSYSFRSLPYKSTILFQSVVSKDCELAPPRKFPVSSLFLRFIQYLRTSPSSSFRHFYLSFPLPFTNMFQKAVLTQDMTSPVGLTSVCCLSDTSRLLDSLQYFFTAHTVGPT